MSEKEEERHELKEEEREFKEETRRKPRRKPREDGGETQGVEAPGEGRTQSAEAGATAPDEGKTGNEGEYGGGETTAAETQLSAEETERAKQAARMIYEKVSRRDRREVLLLQRTRRIIFLGAACRVRRR